MAYYFSVFMLGEVNVIINIPLSRVLLISSGYNQMYILLLIFTARIRRMTGGYIFTLCVNQHLGGGPRSQIFRGGVPGLRFSGRGGPRSQIFWGWGEGPRSQTFWGGSQVSDFLGGGGSPVSIKGKIFDTRFGLIHVQTRKKIFVEGPPPPPWE